MTPPSPLKYDDVIYGRPFTEIFKFQPATRQLVEYLNNGSVVVQVIGKQYVRKSAVARHKGMHTRDLIKSDRGVFSKYVHRLPIQKFWTPIFFIVSCSHYVLFIMPFTFHLIGATLHRKYTWPKYIVHTLRKDSLLFYIVM